MYVTIEKKGAFKIAIILHLVINVRIHAYIHTQTYLYCTLFNIHTYYIVYVCVVIIIHVRVSYFKIFKENNIIGICMCSV